MSKLTYSEKLLDPRWQKKRLEALQTTDWTCHNCGSKEKTLHVHHEFYSKGEPWDIPIHALTPLCDECHKERGVIQDSNKHYLGYIYRNLSNEQLRVFGKTIEGIVKTDIGRDAACDGVSLITDIDLEYRSEVLPYRWLLDNVSEGAANEWSGRDMPKELILEPEDELKATILEKVQAKHPLLYHWLEAATFTLKPGSYCIELNLDSLDEFAKACLTREPTLKRLKETIMAGSNLDLKIV